LGVAETISLSAYDFGAHYPQQDLATSPNRLLRKMPLAVVATDFDVRGRLPFLAIDNYHLILLGEFPRVIEKSPNKIRAV